MDFGHEFRYLDTETERQALVDDFQRIRQMVIAFAEQFPPDKFYEPRYHGWSLAAMLAHLHFMDNICLLEIQLALVGIAPPLSSETLNRINNNMARLFRQRRVTTTLDGIRKNEKRIANLIMRVPLDRFSKRIYYPPKDMYITVEQALQQLFLFHWQEHFATVQRGLVDEPPTSLTE